MLGKQKETNVKRLQGQGEELFGAFPGSGVDGDEFAIK